MKWLDTDQIRTQARRVVRPQTKLGKIALWFGIVAGATQLLRIITRSPSGSMLSGWTEFLSIIFIILLLLLGLRWLRRRLMWRLRNRLIVTYVFIGVIPILLLVCMALLAGYLFAGQFATYIALSDLQSELDHLDAANRALTAQFRSLSRSNGLTPQLAAEIASASDETFRQRSVTVLEGDKGYVIHPGGHIEPAQVRIPEAIKNDFSSFTMEDGHLNLRAVKSVEAGPKRLAVISNVPVNAALLERTASRVGAIELYPPKAASGNQHAPGTKPGSQGMSGTPGQNTVEVDGSRARVNFSGLIEDAPSQNVVVGKVPPPQNAFDREFHFPTIFSATDWQTGEQDTGAIIVSTRPSLLYNVLFGRMGEKAGIFISALAGIAIFFAIIELIALFIGARLTRTMTKAVAELYKATESVNRGDLTHRIRVETKDQMAALEQSFNSMTTSLAKLMAEQKDKQRLENELAIAHEVQELLFPRQSENLPSLEVHGVCRPARTVSGDYYDFIRLPDDRMVLAVGDISGKGISAALLMATVHAFVRAYSLEPELALAPMMMAAAGGPGNGDLYYRGDGTRDGDLAPGRLMTTLNYQLYRATPPEKYATMFLGCYDPGAQSLIYSNGGHLPPILLCRDNSVNRLEASGTVVGLFDGMAYGESRIAMRPGDIFVAFSDGVTEPENEFGEFGEERLIELIHLHRDQPLARISEIVTTAVSDWIGGAEQPDDVTLVLARAM
jgi:sigma-B regulation protein RsbU (phosphoserine phosphatase)